MATVLSITLRTGRNPMPLTSVSRQRKVSLSCLRRLFSGLHGTNLITDIENPNNNCHLKLDTSGVTMKVIVTTISRSISTAGYRNGKNYRNKDHYLARAL